MDRRAFVRASAALGIGAATACRAAERAGSAGSAGEAVGSQPSGVEPGGRIERMGVQLYTARALMAESVPATLDLVASIGYREVEFAGYFGWAPSDLRAALDDRGLISPAAHVPLEDLTERAEATLDAAALLGHEYVIVASLGRSDLESLDGIRRVAAVFNRVGERCRARGLRFAYHNHDAEFRPIEGRVPYDVLLEGTDPALVPLELDLYWISHGGGDPFDYFERWPGRFHLCHVKDRAPDGSMVDVGAGAIDFARIFAQSGRAGLEHYFVEHDRPDDVGQSLVASYRHLAGLEY